MSDDGSSTDENEEQATKKKGRGTPEGVQTPNSHFEKMKMAFVVDGAEACGCHTPHASRTVPTHHGSSSRNLLPRSAPINLPTISKASRHQLFEKHYLVQVASRCFPSHYRSLLLSSLSPATPRPFARRPVDSRRSPSRPSIRRRLLPIT